MQMLGGKPEGAPDREHAKAKQDGYAPQTAQQASGFDGMDDDIPF